MVMVFYVVVVLFPASNKTRDFTSLGESQDCA
jgi:hypothetical protein